MSSWKESSIYWKFRIKPLTCFKHQINITLTIVLLFCRGFSLYYSVFWVNEIFKWNKLPVHFKLILGMIFVVLYKYLNCAVDKTIDNDHTTNIYCNTNYRIILLMLFITSWCQPLKTDPSREICIYANRVKLFFAKYTPL